MGHQHDRSSDTPPAALQRPLLLVLCLALVACAGCASVRTGHAAVSLNHAGQAKSSAGAPLSIRARILPELSSDHLPVLEVSFENRSAAWQRVRSIGLRAADPDRDERFGVPIGDDLYSWHAAISQRQAVQAANRQTALELLLLGGTAIVAVGAETNQRTLKLLGATTSLGAASGLLAAHYAERVRRAESFALVPPAHLLAGPFAVPPGLSTKKWILLYTPDQARPTHAPFILTYVLEDARVARVLLKLGSSRHQGVWRRSAPTKQR